MADTLFGTDGIRGTANAYPITPEIALRAGRAVARCLGTDEGGKIRVLIGKDTRESGSMLEAALISGLVSEGVDVLLAGQIPTPAVALLTEAMGCAAGVMLTASHNPFTDNGIKIFAGDGYKLTDETEAAIEAAILSKATAGPREGIALGAVMHVTDASEKYLSFARSAVAADLDLTGEKVVVDAANGAAFVLAPVILQALGAEVITLGTEPDGRNINDGVGSLHPERAAELVREHGAMMGVCLDGDADRVIFVDERGEVVAGDNLLCMCAKALKTEGKLAQDTLVTTVMANLGLIEALKSDGISVESVAVGDRHVIQRMREKSLNLGGENSGHIIYSDNGTTGDGIVAALKVVELMRTSGKPLSELADCMTTYPQKLVNLRVVAKPAIDEVPVLKSALDAASERLGAKGRVFTRYSGTEKLLRILIEAREQSDVDELAASLTAVVASEIGLVE